MKETERVVTHSVFLFYATASFVSYSHYLCQVVLFGCALPFCVGRHWESSARVYRFRSSDHNALHFTRFSSWTLVCVSPRVLSFKQALPLQRPYLVFASSHATSIIAILGHRPRVQLIPVQTTNRSVRRYKASCEPSRARCFPVAAPPAIDHACASARCFSVSQITPPTAESYAAG